MKQPSPIRLKSQANSKFELSRVMVQNDIMPEKTRQRQKLSKGLSLVKICYLLHAPQFPYSEIESI